MPAANPWTVYLLACADGSLYCGVTTDMDRRLAEHNAGTGAKYTRARLPVTLAASAHFPDRATACRVEWAVKQRPAAEKKDFLARMEESGGPAERGAKSRLGKRRRTGYNQQPAPARTHPESPASSISTMTDIEQYRGKISKEDINDLPLGGYEGDIILVTTPEDAEFAVAEIKADPLLGFDTESRPAFKKGMYFLPSLIQIATQEKVYIFQLSKTPFPESLKTVFEDKGVIKSGVAVRDDVKDLQKLSPFDGAGFLDLGAVALSLKLETHGLRNLAAKFLGIRISKAARCTNWANKDLTSAQIRYAATDAWISRELYLKMDAAGLIPVNGNGNGAAEAKPKAKAPRRTRRPSTRSPKKDS